MDRTEVGRWLLRGAVVSALIASCRDFEQPSPTNEASGSQSGETQAGQDQSGQSPGGTAPQQQNHGGQVGASAGASPHRDDELEGGAAGDAMTSLNGGEGGGPTPPEPARPPLLGTVLIRAGSTICAGTLQTNAWVLTAGHCIPSSVDTAELEVHFGLDRHNPLEVAGVLEVVRFGPPDELGDLALLRLTNPLTLDGSTTGYHRRTFFEATQYLSSYSLYCLGWAGEANATRGEVFEVDEIEITNQPRIGANSTVWVQSAFAGDGPSSPDTPLSTDNGGGCFTSIGGDWYQATVQLETRVLGGDDRARTASLTDSATREWMLRTMMGREPVVGISPARGLGTWLNADGEVEMLWIDEAGSLFHAPLSDSTDVQPLERPAGVTFVVQRPAAAVYGQQTHFVAYGDDGQLWSRVSDSRGVTDWTVLSVAQSPSTGAALVNVAGGTLHLFALGSTMDLRHSSIEHGQWSDWYSFGGPLKGTPSASSFGPGRIDTVFRSADDSVIILPYANRWLPSLKIGVSAADPLVIDSALNEVNIFIRNDLGHLALLWHHWGWLDAWVDTGISAGTTLTGVSRTPGSYDLLVTDGHAITHVWWPR